MISVVMTAFNAEKYIQEAIDSVLAQTWKDFEFIIVDDASRDKTVSLIESYRDPRIVFLKNPTNLGQTRSLNLALKKAKGKYIARIDADDVCEPERFKIQHEYLESHLEIAVVGSWALDINEEGQSLRVFKTPTDPVDIKCYLMGCGDLSYYCLIHPSVMIRLEALKSVGLYNEARGTMKGYPQDYELWARLMPHFEFANIPQVLLKYRVLRRSDSRDFMDVALPMRMMITKEKIQTYCPNFKEDQVAILAQMLEFRPPHNREESQKVLSLFNQYFDQVLKRISSPQKELLKSRMKYFYLPQLLKTNPLLALTEYLKIIFSHPTFVGDSKFYKKIGKANVLTTNALKN